MSTFKAVVVKVGTLEKHFDADTLLVTKVFDYPVIVKNGEVYEGELAVYIPITALLPKNDQRFAHLFGKDGRIRARKIRGVFSMGALIRAPQGVFEGDDVTDALNIKRWEPQEDSDDEHETPEDLLVLPRYENIDNFRTWPNILRDCEDVTIREKFHGNNVRFTMTNNGFVIASRRAVISVKENLQFKYIAEKFDLAAKIAHHPDIVMFGELLGCKDLKYGFTESAPGFVVFEAQDKRTMSYLPDTEFETLAKNMNLPTATILYRGPWSKSLTALADGQSSLGHNIKEGFVVKPVTERFAKSVGRVILKYHSEKFLLSRK
jgi:RNA ligase (TIGR02306 family)